MLQRTLTSLILFLLVGCAPVALPGSTASPSGSQQSTPFVIGAIPDQDPERLQRLYTQLASYLAEELDVPVEYKPVTDYAASVTAFRVGDLDMVWFGGLTGVQARLQVPDAMALVQRDLDANFRSVFIANRVTGLLPFDDLQDLAQLKGLRFTFGSVSSTSGRLMPQYFLGQAGVTLEDFQGEPGFSGAHDITIKLVEAGTYDAGALNENVWRSRVAAGAVDLDQIIELWWTPPYHDYHWVLRGDSAARYGDGFAARVVEAFTSLDAENPQDKEILDLFGAQQFIPTENDNYAQIEAVAREIGMIE